MNTYKNFVINLVSRVGEIMRNDFRLGMQKGWKEDNTPVTATDIAINKLVIEEIRKSFPEHSVLGEEDGNQGKSDLVWVCDPLDGTVPFSHGYPIFVFSIALTRKGKSVLGAIYDPVMDRLAFAEKGKGAFLNNKKITVSQKNDFANALINLDADYRLPLRQRLIQKEVFATTLYSAVYGGLLVACGEFVAEIYDYNKPWDGAAVKVIVEEAGGKVTDLLGNEQRYDQPINGFIASNGPLHNELVELIKSTPTSERSN
jgi:fructose-1,6-bisphosphatase/inositol monophosphatase family enzyme